MKLSIIVPVFNEQKTIAQVLKNLSEVKIPGVEIEIIVVNDGSTDNTEREIKKVKLKGMKFYSHNKNQGKGAAVRTGVGHATGELVLTQDADLEYSPADIIKLIKPIRENSAKVVYGTRLKRLPNFSRDERTFRFFTHYLGNKFLSLCTTALYGQPVSDMETGYKLFPKSALANVQLKSKGFEFEPEITAKLLKKGYHITEVPIATNPRGYDEGKKLHTVRDGAKALWALIKYRITN